MATTVFVNGVTLTDAGWFNDANHVIYGSIVCATALGAACDGSTDDWSAINTYVTAEATAGRRPMVSFPPGSTTVVSQALPFRTGGVYMCIGGYATIKAHSTSTDNVIGEASPVAAYSQCHLENLIVDGNRANVSYNTRSAGATDDSYQNGLRLNQVAQSVFRNVRVQEAVFNGFSVYAISSDNVFDNCWATNIGKSTNIVSGASSYNGIFVEFGCDRNKFICPYINTTRGTGLLEVCQGADNYENQYIFPHIVSAGVDGIAIKDDSGTNVHHRCRIIAPIVESCVAVGAVAIRVAPNSTGSVDDLHIVSPTITGCANGIVTGGIINKMIISEPNIQSNTGAGITIGASAVDCQIVGGVSLLNGTQLTDNGTRTLVSGLIQDASGTYNTNKGITSSGDIKRTGASGSTLQFLLNQSGVVQWYLKNLATTGAFSIGSGGLGDMITITTAGAVSIANGGNTLGFYGATPVAKQLLATGAGATVDNVITALQQLGLVKQS